MNAPDRWEACRLAQNLARNCGYAVFPCGDGKRPTLKRWPERASNKPEVIEQLWRDHPGTLVGIVTGEESGIDVLDLDVKHDGARAWYRIHRDRLPATRTYRTRNGGAHLYFRHADGVRNSAGKIAEGVDVRGTGGYAISWWCAKLHCLEQAPPTSWPAWLLNMLLTKPAPPPLHLKTKEKYANAAIDGVLRVIRNAPEGKRNDVLHWSACCLGKRALAGHIGTAEAECLLIAAGIAAGLPEKECRATVLSGLRRAVA